MTVAILVSLVPSVSAGAGSFGGALKSVGYLQFDSRDLRGRFTSVDAGRNHTLAVGADGSLRSWGLNVSGESGPAPQASSIISASAGVAFSVALDVEGRVQCWGYDGYGQCSVPAGLPAVSSVSAGLGHVVALAESGVVWCWGRADYGQTATPTGLRGAIGVSAGEFHSAAVDAAGRVWAWDSPRAVSMRIMGNPPCLRVLPRWPPWTAAHGIRSSGFGRVASRRGARIPRASARYPPVFS
jgi:alpha-tubulin suppressor-like RCC1 family protein